MSVQLWAMVDDGWLLHGVEGMTEPQQLIYDIAKDITNKDISP